MLKVTCNNVTYNLNNGMQFEIETLLTCVATLDFLY